MKIDVLLRLVHDLQERCMALEVLLQQEKDKSNIQEFSSE